MLLNKHRLEYEVRLDTSDVGKHRRHAQTCEISAIIQRYTSMVLLQTFYMGEQYRRAYALLNNSKLVDADIRCRYLAARCLANMKEWDDCLNMMGGDPAGELDMLRRQVSLSSTPCTVDVSTAGPSSLLVPGWQVVCLHTFPMQMSTCLSVSQERAA